MKFHLKEELTPEGIICHLHGYLEQEGAEELSAQIRAWIAQGWSRFVLDFSNSPVINSHAIGELIEITGQSVDRDELQFLICGLNSVSELSFRVAGIFYFSELHHNLPAARASLKAMARDEGEG